jgi:hypothetical protein
MFHPPSPIPSFGHSALSSGSQWMLLDAPKSSTWPWRDAQWISDINNSSRTRCHQEIGQWTRFLLCRTLFHLCPACQPIDPGASQRAMAKQSQRKSIGGCAMGFRCKPFTQNPLQSKTPSIAAISNMLDLFGPQSARHACIDHLSAINRLQTWHPVAADVRRRTRPAPHASHTRYVKEPWSAIASYATAEPPSIQAADTHPSLPGGYHTLLRKSKNKYTNYCFPA